MGNELGFRFAVVQAGHRLGWASIAVVLTGVALDVGGRDRRLVIGLTLAAAAGNAAAMLIPWREWLATARGARLLDVWCAGLIGFVALLVVAGGPTYALLLFVTVPFIAVVQGGRRRGLWLGVAVATCAFVAALVPGSVGATAIRLALVATAVTVALVLTRALRNEAARAEVQWALAREADHRIKNDLQAAADLLLLGRPKGEDSSAFDDAAARIRAIANVHRLLTDAEDEIDGAALVRSIVGDAPVSIEAEPIAFDASTAQTLGIVVNELVTNALRHGTPPVVVTLRGGTRTQLRVDDGGGGNPGSAGFGLGLVRKLVESGLGGDFELTRGRGRTRAEVVFPR